jgi:replicative DNA helicase
MALVQRVEEVILNQLIHNEDYFRKVFPYIEREYFQERLESRIFDSIKEYVNEYSVVPSIDTVSLLINSKGNVTQDELNEINTYINELLIERAHFPKLSAIVDKTEQFCKDRAMYNAIIDAMGIINGDDDRTTTVIPELMKDALKVSFSSSIGLDYSDPEERYDRLHQDRGKIKFDIDALNVITNGGLANKTLNVVMTPTGGGKSLLMCHCAASTLTQGKNVLYITLEMSEENIAQRIDANLMDTELDEFSEMEKDTFVNKFKKVLKGNGFLSRMFGIKKKSKLGQLFIKEYPTGAGNANHFRFLLDELELKKGFSVDFIVIDYLNICSSTRLLPMSGSYSYVKSIAEELRGLAVEYDVPILTGTQANRGGFENSDIDLTNTSESMGLPSTADLFIAMMSNEELSAANRALIKQLKNRYRDENKNKYFSIGIDKPKMRLYHVDDAFNYSGGEGELYEQQKEKNDYQNNNTTKKVQKETKFTGIKI